MAKDFTSNIIVNLGSVDSGSGLLAQNTAGAYTSLGVSEDGTGNSVGSLLFKNENAVGFSELFVSKDLTVPNLFKLPILGSGELRVIPITFTDGISNVESNVNGEVDLSSLNFGGDVTKVGTPVDNQIGVWTGDGTLEGDSNFTWDGNTLNANVSGTTSILDLNRTDAAGFLRINFTATNTNLNSNNGYIFKINNQARLTLDNSGSIRFDDYGSGTFTGTAAYNLSVDASGNIIETPNSSGSNSEFTKAITIESPTSSEDITMFYTDVAITVTQLNAVSRGTTPSVTYTIRHNSDRNATGAEVVTSGSTTTSTTTGDEVTSFNDATIPAGSWIWFETTAQSGTVDELNVTIEYTID